MMRSILIGILVLMAAGVGFLTFQWYRTMHGGEPYGAPFTLVDQTGGAVTEKAFRAQPTAVFFGFTHCPEVCPTTLAELDGWLKTLGPQGKDIKVYFVTVDPERDTPKVLNDYVTAVSDRITGVTGSPDAIAAMTKAFGIYARKVPMEGDDYTMDHTASVLLLSKGGQFAGTIAYGENPEAALTKLKRLAAEG